MYLTIDEVKVMRMALNKAPLTRGVIDMIEKVDMHLKECGWVLEHRALPKKKYQHNTRYEYVWENVK